MLLKGKHPTPRINENLRQRINKDNGWKSKYPTEKLNMIPRRKLTKLANNFVQNNSPKQFFAESISLERIRIIFVDLFFIVLLFDLYVTKPKKILSSLVVNSVMKPRLSFGVGNRGRLEVLSGHGIKQTGMDLEFFISEFL